MPKNFNRVFNLAAQRYLTSIRVWLYVAPFLIIGLIFSELNEVWTPEAIYKTLAVGLLGHLALGLVLLIGSQTVLHPSKRATAGWKQVLAVLVPAAVIRSLVIAQFAVIFQVGDWNLINRVPTSIILVSFSFIYFSYSSELWRTYRKKRDDLLLSIAVGESASQSQSIATSGMAGVTSGGINQELETIQRKTLEALGTIKQRLNQADAKLEDFTDLLDDSDRDWRAASHRAWNSGNPRVPKVSAGELIRTMATSKPLSLIALASGPLYGVARVSQDLPITDSLQIFAIWLAGSLLLAWLTNEASFRSNRNQVLLFVFGLAATLFWGLFVGQFYLVTDNHQSQQAFVVLVSTLASVGMGIAPALEKSGDSVISRLEQRLGASTVQVLKNQGEMFVLARRIAAYLHSEVRGEFLRLAMQLRTALEIRDLVQAREIVGQMESLTRQVDLSLKPIRPAQDFQLFLANWGEVIRIESNLEQFELSALLQGKIEALVMDAVNDAVRHGGASWISIRLLELTDGYRLEVESDSKVNQEQQRIGLGSLALAQLSSGDWSRGPTENGKFLLSINL